MGSSDFFAPNFIWRIVGREFKSPRSFANEAAMNSPLALNPSRPIRTLSCTYQEDSMDSITYTTARANPAATMDRVCEDHEPVVVTRNEQSVVMMSLEDYNALEETAYLLRSPKNAMRLLEGIAALEAGRGKVRKLLK
jgi:antitoxin YefM